MANPELGAKQICPTCQSKFYDLGRRPALCPKCGASFDPEEAVKTRRVRRGPGPDYESDSDTTKADKVRDPDAEDEEEEDDEAEKTPEIDEAAAAEPLEVDDAEEEGATKAGDSDIGVDFAEDEDAEAEEDDDVPFLEEEDEDFPDEEIEGPPDGDDPNDH